jgi:hypothetical protein
MTGQLTRLVLALILTLAASSAFAQATTASTEDRRGAEDAPAAGPGPSLGPPYTLPRAVASPGTVLRHGYFSINGAYQGTSNSFTNAWSRPYYLETESLSSTYSIKPGVLIDLGAGVRVWRDLALGVAVSRYHRSDLASVTATVPHPLLYQQPRSFSGTTAGPSRTETAVHASAMWVVAVAPRMQVGLFGGPSFFQVNQTVISTVTFAEAYPFTSVTVASTTTQSQTKSKIGFNGGGDVTILLYKQIGVGVLLRYSGVTIGFTGPDGAAVPVKAGGLQAGAGLRIRF